MAPPNWTTSEQYAFLSEQLERYGVAKQNANFKNFWGSLYEQWFNKYPEIENCFPDKELTSLTESEEESLRNAIQKRREQLQNWYRWRTAARARVSNGSRTVKSLFSEERLPKKADMFVEMFELQSQLKERLDAVCFGKDESWIQKNRIGERSRISRDLWKHGTPEMKSAVEAKLAALAEKKKSTSASLTPEEYRQGIEACPRHMGPFFTRLAEQTGWAFTVLMGGPDPSKPNGEITVCSYHVGETSLSQTFGETHQDFDAAYMIPYTQFLRNVFPDDVCRSRSLEDKKTLNTSTSESSVSKEAPSSSSSPSSGPLNLAVDSIKSFPISSPTSFSVPQSNPKPSNPKPSNNNPLHVAAPSVFSNDPPNPAPISVQSANASPHELTLANYVLPSPDPSHAQYGFVSHGGSMAWSSGLQPDLEPLLPLLPGVDLNFGSFNPFTDGTTDSLASSGIDPSTGVSYSAPDYFGTGFNFAYGLPFVAATTVTGDSLPSATSTTSSSSSAGITDIMTHPVSLTSDPTVSTSAITTTSSPSFSSISDATTSPVSLTLAEPVVPAGPISPANTSTNPDPPSSSEPANGTMSSDPFKAIQEGQETEVARRSSRTVIPSTRADKMNEIGSREKDSRNKENDGPMESNTQNTPPEWMVAAHAYFTSGDMGDEWRSCVDAWVMLEEKLEYGVHGKGVLPSTKLRPTEWSKWISKTRNSQRCYSATPDLTNSPEFGGAVYAWWHDMQPAFRKDSTGALVDSMDHGVSAIGDAWSTLRKGGPNGLVSVLTLLMWWGLNVDLGPWHESSVPQWKVTVRDVTSSLRKMAEGSVGGKKRVSTEGSNTRRAKRLKV